MASSKYKVHGTDHFSLTSTQFWSFEKLESSFVFVTMNVWKVYVDGSNLLRVQHVSFNLIRVVINNPGCICCCSADSHVGLDGIFCVLWCHTRHEKWSQIAKLSLYNNNFAEKYMKVKTVEDEIFKLFCKIDCLTHQYNLHKKAKKCIYNLHSILY